VARLLLRERYKVTNAIFRPKLVREKPTNGRMRVGIEMLDTQLVTTRISEWVIGHFPLARDLNIAPSTSLLDGGIVDSMGTLDIVMFLEEEFDLTMDDEDLIAENFGSIDAIAQFVQLKRSA
jgi:acyl carrier protein